MKSKVKSTDPEMLAALRRAAVRARKRAKATGTPLYVMKNGRITNLNPGCRPKKRIPDFL